MSEEIKIKNIKKIEKTREQEDRGRGREKIDRGRERGRR